jgi:hypothetical protein
MSAVHEPDLLYGAKAIAGFLGLPRRAAEHRIDAGLIPTFKMGGTICARRSTLNAWLAEAEARAQAERDAAQAGES